MKVSSGCRPFSLHTSTHTLWRVLLALAASSRPEEEGGGEREQKGRGEWERGEIKGERDGKEKDGKDE